MVPVVIKRLVLFCIILCCSLNLLVAQPYYFRHYQVENGLSNNAAIACLQDKRGFLWFGTKDGLNRFDGYSFKIFRNDPNDPGSIGSNFIHCLYEDAGGVLWVGTENGLYSYNEKSERFSLLPASANAPVGDVKMDGNGNLWYTQLFHLSRYEPKKKILQSYPITNDFEVSSICTTPSGQLWVSTASGHLKRYEYDTDSFTSYNVFKHSKAAISTWIERIVATKDGNILIGTSNGAKIFDVVNFDYKDILTYNPDKTEIFVRNFLEINDHEIWIATESGIYIYNTQTGHVNNLQKKYNDPYSISDNAVYAFCKDREGGIWAGTYFGGVNYFPKQHTAFQKFFPQTGENSLSGNVVREIHSDSNDNLWIGTEDAGLNKYNPGTGRFTVYKPTGKKNSISYTNIHGMLVDGNKLWIGTFEHGLDIMNMATGEVIKHYSMGSAAGDLNSNFIFYITKTSDGDVLVGTTRGAFKYVPENDNFVQLTGMPLYNWYSYLLKDDRKILWAATYGNGVNFYNTVTKKNGNFRYKPLDSSSIASDRVNSIFEDSKKNLWFATEGGLSRYDYTNNKFKTYTTADGFPSNFILSVLEDKEHNLWLSTSKGIVSFDPSTKKVIVYTSTNGTLNDQFNFNSAYQDSRGNMYFGSVKGMTSFNPETFTKNSFIPPVYITGFQVFNNELTIGDKNSPLKRSITYTDKITLNYQQSTFSIDFASLSYAAPEMSEYAYAMEGLDNRWTYLKSNRKAYFTDLSPGEYIFKVKGTNSSGLWNNVETRLTIQVLPPWWASFWAYSFYVLVVIAVIVYSIRSYHKKTEEKNRRKFELLETAKEKEVFKAKIEFFTNVAHEIKTPLTLIKGPLEKVMKKADNIPELQNNLKIMDRNTNRLIELTNQLLDFRQTESHGFSLSFVKTNIPEMLEETFVSFKSLAEQKNVDFKLYIPGRTLFAYIDQDAFKKIIYNLFSNAVKYADSKAFVRLLPSDRKDSYFTIEFSNDGFIIPADMNEKIFEPFFRLRETEKQKGTGIGLALSRSLAELHNGKLQLNQTENGMNNFSLSLPIHQQNEFNLAINRVSFTNISQQSQ